ncbi:glutamate--cysteine ligase [Candidatus Pandoraea novymonadis]|uniref:glutamate--cysteine ligase n=1 Tax=Candidatus Pandoraea novymonadis TaxID=1808959 RepID=UPI000D067C8E|nr:glutamate--cysteine ligase [Candidatus Pandoraea novymonadis]
MEKKNYLNLDSALYQRRLSLFSQFDHRSLLCEGLSGVERETLRIDKLGALALTPHPQALGSALTNDEITTDYSEALLEFITPPQNDPEKVIARLEEIHRFTYQVLDDEMLWVASMPPTLPSESIIPIAWYGTSNIGKLKHVYRRGLAFRYGKRMQCIAGIHYNFSLADSLWAIFHNIENSDLSLRDYQSLCYIGMIRNFHRYSWLLMYLFGASPALQANFLDGLKHDLERYDDETLYLPYATSLRMSDLGYQSNAQSGVSSCYDSLTGYIAALVQAVSQPHPPYETIGTQRDGEWLQLSTNLLQIENEFYATIRPKRVTYSGEKPVQALARRGVQYVEVRCIDIDPFNPVGIDVSTARFIDAFLLFCALEESPKCSVEENLENRNNFSLVVKEGRKPGLTLHCNGAPITLKKWANDLLKRIDLAAEQFDSQRGGTHYAEAMAIKRALLDDPSLTPSARVLHGMADFRNVPGGAFQAFTLLQSQRHAERFRLYPLDALQTERFQSLAQKSLDAQVQLESAQIDDFEKFLAAYNAGTLGAVPA